MSSRERTLAVLLGGFIVIVILAVLGYVAVYMPLTSLNKEIAELDKEIGDKTDKLALAERDLPRVDAALKRSLPADHDVARQEYDAALNKVLRDAKVPGSVYTISPTSVDSRPIPEMSPKKPAYHRIALRITMKPVDLATLLDVLNRYYRLNLLHQITAFTVKKMEGGSVSRRGGSTVSDKADLDVTLTTEAIILDGAENRRTLFSIPLAMGAVGGVAGYQLLNNGVPEPARGLSPIQIARVLASTDRDYTALLVQDVFHGPPPPAPKVDRDERPPKVDKPKDDTSPYIRLTGFGRNSDGTGSAFIQDLAGRLEYEIEMKREKGGKLVAKVEKFYYTKNSRKSYGPETDLEISEETSATKRLFHVIGFDNDAILLGELALGEALATPAAPAPRPFGPPGGGFPQGGFPGGGVPPGGFDDQFGGGFAFPPPGPAVVKGPTKPKVPASTAVVGGFGYVLPQQKVFAWKHGEPLSKITELYGDESRKAIQRATAPPSDPTTKLAGDAGRD